MGQTASRRRRRGLRQLSIRGFDEPLERHLRAVAAEEGISLNKAVLRTLRKGAGLAGARNRTATVGDALDTLIGRWSAAEAERFLEGIQPLEAVDERFWR
ncbi:MAG: hypothetical protein ACRD09_01535 [Vicinamibacterales bacterium]